MSKQFGEHTPALEVVEGIDLKGYEVIVTGGNSGIGVETMRALAKAGARCILCTRDVEKGQKVADELINSTGNYQIEVEQLELDSLDNVDSFVQRYLAKNRPLHILINNAGIMACPKSFTKDGFETQFGVNHLGHFALTVGLMPALKEGARQLKKKSRVINVTSTLHALSKVDFQDINFKNGRDYNDFVSYGQSKTCNCLFSLGLTKPFSNDGIVSYSVMPGAIRTNLGRYMSPEDWVKRGWVDENGKPLITMKSVEAGASTSVWAATAPELEGKSGLYLENCAIGKEESNVEKILLEILGYAPFIMDEEAADKLWDISEEFLKKRSP